MMNQISLQQLDSLESLRLEVSRVSEISTPQIQVLIDTLTRYGCTILQSQPGTSPQAELLGLQGLLGGPLVHSDSTTEGITEITPRSEQASFAALTHKQNLPHTDGSYLPTPPPLVALQCEVPARVGGETIIIQAEALHQYLTEVDPEGLGRMYSPSAITIHRQERNYSYPIFRTVEGGRVRTAFKPDQDEPSFSTIPHPQIRATVERMQAFLQDPNHQLRFKLQPDQILILDNLRVFHGRTALGSPEQHPARKLNRLWFNGHSPYQDQWELGFYPLSQPVWEAA